MVQVHHMRTWLVLMMLAAPGLIAAQSRQLFNGKDLVGWNRLPRHGDAASGQAPGFTVKDGMLVTIPSSPEDDTSYTAEMSGNAASRAAYKVSASNATSGVLIRITAEPQAV